MEMPNRTGFEREWEDAFNDAEMEVSPDVWNRVELEIANTSTGKFKRRLLLFQLLAAASVAFALSIGGVGVYELYLDRNAGDTEIADDRSAARGERTEEIDKNAINEGDHNSSVPGVPEEGQGLVADTHEAKGVEAEPSADEEKGAEVTETDGRRLMALAKDNEGEGPILKAQGEGVKKNDHEEALTMAVPHLVDKKPATLPVDLSSDIELQQVPQFYVHTRSQKHGYKDVWAGVGFSAGSFVPHASSGQQFADGVTGMENNFDRPPSFSEEQIGQAHNLGLNVGTKISEKWMLLSGISYTRQQTVSTSNVVGVTEGWETRALSGPEEVTSVDAIRFTAPYDVANVQELISVPLQAGYVLVDQKFGVVLLGGVAHNILLRNKVGDLSGELGEVTVSAGESSRYRTYQLSGLIGTVFSYCLNDHYQLSVVPQVRQSINSITKDDAEYAVRPTTLEVGFRLTYMFNN